MYKNFTYYISVLTLTVSLGAGCDSGYHPPDPMDVSGADMARHEAPRQTQRNEPPKKNVPVPTAPPAGRQSLARNPFLTQEEEAALFTRKPVVRRVSGDEIVLPSGQLSAIFYSEDMDASYAIIQGQILQQGEFLGDRQVLQISPDHVVLAGPDEKQYVINLNSLEF